MPDAGFLFLFFFPLQELIKYSARLKENTTDLEKAYDFMQAIPQRIADLQYINSIQGYKGNIHKLGRILKHVSIYMK